MGRSVARLSLVAVLLVLVPWQDASRAASDPRVDAQAWADTGAVPVAAPQDGRLYVVATGGLEQARSFLHVNVTGLDRRALRAARLVLAEDAAQSVAVDRARLSACALREPIGGQGRLEGDAPEADCTLRVDAARATDGTWAVPLTVFATRWTTAENHGLALWPVVEDAGATYRVAFDPSRTSLAGVGAPEPEPDPDPEPDPEPGPDPGPTTEMTVPPTTVFPSLLPPPDAGPTVPTVAMPSTSPTTTVLRRQTGTSPDVLAAFGRDAASPPVLPFLGALVVLTTVVLVTLRRRGRRVAVPPRLSGERGLRAGIGAVALAVALLPLAASELTAFKAGFVVIFVVGALGLHVLVNWAGLLSLAHAPMVGLPAFLVLAVSSEYGISPLYLIPMGALVGAAVGMLLGLPVLRAKGLQVALVTFTAGVAIQRFFFNKSWLVGPVGGRRAATPALGPVELETSKGLYVVVLAIALVIAVALWAVMHSRVARGWFWIRSDADAAAAFGVPVARYKLLAFATAGALAGVAGSLSVAWIGQLAGDAFPFSLSFDYLLVAVLAGPGYAGGVVAAALLLQGGRLFFTFFGWVDVVFDYAGPVALILNLTKRQAGFNGLGRMLMEKLRSRRRPQGEQAQVPAPEPLSPTLVGGTVAVVAGFISIAVAWYHTGNTDQVWLQNQELVSGGIGGLALVVVGAALLIRDRLGRQQAILLEQLAALRAVAPPVVPSELLPEAADVATAPPSSSRSARPSPRSRAISRHT